MTNNHAVMVVVVVVVVAAVTIHGSANVSVTGVGIIVVNLCFLALTCLLSCTSFTVVSSMIGWCHILLNVINEIFVWFIDCFIVVTCMDSTSVGMECFVDIGGKLLGCYITFHCTLFY